MNNERKIKVSLAVFISAVMLAIIFDLLTVNGAFSPITVGGKMTGLGNPAVVMDIVAVISVTYYGLCILFHDSARKALGFTVSVSVIMALSVLVDYVLIHSHYSVYFPTLLFLYFLVSISPFVSLFIFKFTT